MNIIYIGAGILVAGFLGMIIYSHYKTKNAPVFKKSANIKLLSAKNFKGETGNGLVLVEFWAAGYEPCKIMAPVLNELADNNVNALSVARISVEQFQQVAQKYKVKSLPTLILFKNGIEVNRITGVKTKRDILKQVAQYA